MRQGLRPEQTGPATQLYGTDAGRYTTQVLAAVPLVQRNCLNALTVHCIQASNSST